MNKTREELVQKYKDARAELQAFDDAQTMERLKQSEIIKKYRYIILNTDHDPDMQDMYDPEQTVLVGLTAYNDQGYVDDHIPDEAREDVYDLLGILGLSECMSCTYDVDKKDWPKVKETFEQLGITEEQPEW